MTAIVIKVPDSAFIGALRNLYEQGEINLEQFGACLRRYSNRKWGEKNGN